MNEDAYAAALTADARLIARRMGTKVGGLPKSFADKISAAQRNADLVYAAIGAGRHTQLDLSHGLSLSIHLVCLACQIPIGAGLISGTRKGRCLHYEIVT